MTQRHQRRRTFHAENRRLRAELAALRQQLACIDTARPSYHAERLEQVSTTLITYLAEQKQHAAQTLPGRHTFQRLADMAPVLIAVYNLPTLEVVYCNQELLSSLGYSFTDIERLGGAATPTLVHPDDLLPFDQLLNHFQRLQPGEVDVSVIRIRAANGEWRWLLFRQMVFAHAADGTPRQIVAVAIDITSVQTATLELAETNAQLVALNADLTHSRDLLQAVFDNVHDGLALFASDGTVLAVNRALACIHRTTPADLLGDDLGHCLIPIRPLIARTVAERQPQHVQHQVHTTQGELRTFALETIPLYDATGTIEQVVFHVMDRTDQFQLEALRLQNEHLLASSRLAALVAHELNTPLQAAQNYLYLVADHTGDDEAIGHVHEELDRMAAIVRRLLEFQRAETQGPTVILMPELIERVLLLTGSRLQHQRIKVVRELGPRLPPIMGHDAQLTLVLLNLVLRSAETMPEGGTLRISAVTVDTPPDAGPRAMVVVLNDTGSALATASSADGPFYRVDTTGPEMRLELCRRLIEHQGGTMRQWSESGAGHTVQITLPMLAAEPTVGI